MKDIIEATLQVNGAQRTVAANPSRRLSDVLRSDLGLTGTKVGCNAGDCGACTVLLDGKQAHRAIRFDTLQTKLAVDGSPYPRAFRIERGA